MAIQMPQKDDMMQRAFAESYKKEAEAAAFYELAAKLEKDDKRRDILLKLEQIEREHALIWAAKLSEVCGIEAHYDGLSQLSSTMSKQDVYRKLDEIEVGNAKWYDSLKQLIPDDHILDLIDRIDEDESNHDATIRCFFTLPTQHIADSLQRILSRETWHKRESTGWLGDAIYGVNDGLGAIFGIIAGVAGYTANSHTVLVSGFFGAVASTLSMGAGAWLATRSQNELHHSEMQHELREIRDDPSLEREELSLLYQLKGFTQSEAEEITERLSMDEDQFAQAMYQEELGIAEDSEGNAWKSAGVGSLSTFIGGIIPLIPFIFLGGVVGMIAAAIVSIIAHFLVGAAKSMVTARTWWASGLEMTAAGIVVGVVSYGIGLLGTMLVHV